MFVKGLLLRERKQKQLKERGRDRSSFIPRLMKNRKENGLVDARRCSFTTSKKARTRMSTWASSLRGLHWLAWVASWRPKGLLDDRKNLFHSKTHDEKSEEET